MKRNFRTILARTIIDGERRRKTPFDLFLQKTCADMKLRKKFRTVPTPLSICFDVCVFEDFIILAQNEQTCRTSVCVNTRQNRNKGWKMRPISSLLPMRTRSDAPSKPQDACMICIDPIASHYSRPEDERKGRKRTHTTKARTGCAASSSWIILLARRVGKMRLGRE